MPTNNYWRSVFPQTEKSISRSDKFGVFPIIGKYTKDRFHVKTEGTR